MLEPSFSDQLEEVLRHLGMRLHDGYTFEGFPIELRSSEGELTVVETMVPPVVGSMDPEKVGLAIVDAFGVVQRIWGVAHRVPTLTPGQALMSTDIARLVESAIVGDTGTCYVAGFRFFVSPMTAGNRPFALLLVTEAGEEQKIRHDASLTGISSHLLTQIGKVLSSNQTVSPLATTVVHEIASGLNLAAVLLWAANPEDSKLTLRASVGVTRDGAQLVKEINPASEGSCLAEFVAKTGQAVALTAVHDHVLTEQLEAKFCYLEPGAVEVVPLVVSDRLVGVLECIARRGDTKFPVHHRVRATVAEHLSLALNSALLFENVQRLATHDPLTGIANHRALQDYLQRSLSEAVRKGHPVTAIMLDVDNFRNFNEEEGHDLGDQALRMVAQALNDCVRDYDLAARYGGEEFTLIMPHIDANAAAPIAERIRQHIEEIRLVTATGHLRPVTASLGIASFPMHSTDSATTLRAADLALYEAKREGRNRIKVYSGQKLYGGTRYVYEPNTLDHWVAEQDRPAARHRCHVSRPFIDFLIERLGLPHVYSDAVLGLLHLGHTYAHAMDAGDVALVQRMKQSEEIAPIWSALQAMQERFDGTGPLGLTGHEIPVLARVALVVDAMIEGAGLQFVQDPSRFDPDLVMFIAEYGEAA